MTGRGRRRRSFRERYDTLLGAAALASPAYAAVAFGFWLELGPRSDLDAACGISDVTGAGSYVLFLLPGVVVGAWARWTRRRLSTAAVLVAGTLLVTA